MPGEQYGIPNSMPNGMQGGGLLSNPYLQLGLGILANNNSKNLGQVLGRGALQGLGNLQQQQSFQAQLAQQQQIAKLNEARQKQIDQEMQQQELQNAAIQEASQKNPELAQLFRLDPKAAIRTLYPQTGNVVPFFTPIATENGLGSYDNRTGKFEPLNINGKPIVKSTDSPVVRGAVKFAEAEGTASFNPNTTLPGLAITDKQYAEMVDPSLGKSPLLPSLPTLPITPTTNPKPSGMPSMQIPPSLQQERDRKRLEVLLQEQKDAGGAGKNAELDKEIKNAGGGNGIGVVIPTPEQQAALTKRAEKEAEQAVNLSGERKQAIKKSDQLLSAASQAKLLLNQNPTGSLAGAGFDALGRAVGYSPKSAQVASKLETLSGWMVANVPRMEGPQSNFDVQNYQIMAGKVGDRTAPVEERRAALDQLIQLQEKYKSLNQDTVEKPILPTNERMPTAKARPPMKGQVVNGYKFKGGNPADQNNWELK